MNSACNGMASARFCAAAAGAVILASGCATPINSRPLEANEPVSGFVYHLTRAKVVATVDVRLESCDPPAVVVSPPKVVASPAADPGKGSSFFVDPSDSWSIFKSTSGAQIQLTNDGRLGKAKAQTKDATIPLIGEIAKYALLSATPSVALAIMPKDKDDLEKVPPKPKRKFACGQQAGEMVVDLHDLRAKRETLLRRERQFIANGTFRKGDGDALKAYSDSLVQLNARIEGLEKALTKTVRLDVSPPATDRKPPGKTTRLDLRHGWFGARTDGELKCRDENKEANISAADGFQCLMVTAAIEAVSQATPAPIASDLTSSGFPGVLYRMPAAGKVAITIAVKDDDSAEPDVGVFVKSSDPMSSNQSNALRITASSPLTTSDHVRVPQWGAISGLRSDLGPLSSNGVEIEFDEWSVPKTVSWSAEAGGLASLLGISSQVETARQKAEAPADPAVALRSELHLRLLQTCLEAPTGSIPSYCSGLAK